MRVAIFRPVPSAAAPWTSQIYPGCLCWQRLAATRDGKEEAQLHYKYRCPGSTSTAALAPYTCAGCPFILQDCAPASDTKTRRTRQDKTDGQTDRQAGRQAGRQICRQAGRQAGKQGLEMHAMSCGLEHAFEGMTAFAPRHKDMFAAHPLWHSDATRRCGKDRDVVAADALPARRRGGLR
eukprot:363474-Chlamydomonas_euryale.AAC.24